MRGMDVRERGRWLLALVVVAAVTGPAFMLKRGPASTPLR